MIYTNRKPRKWSQPYLECVKYHEIKEYSKLNNITLQNYLPSLWDISKAVENWSEESGTAQWNCFSYFSFTKKNTIEEKKLKVPKSKVMLYYT